MLVILSRKAKKQYDKLQKLEQTKIKKKIKALETDPLLGKKLTGELHSYRSIRSWPYRIIYQINESENRVEISDILHRQGAYK